MKMKTFLSVAIATSLLSFNSCKKEKENEGQTKVHGQILEKGSGKPIAGATVQLIENDYRTYNTVETVHDETVTGPDGRYSFSFKAKGDYYKVAANAPMYYTNNPDKQLDDNITIRKEQKLDVELVAYAWLKLRFLNQSGADGVDVNSVGAETFGYQIYNSNDATVIAQAFGNQDNSIYYFPQPEGQPRISTVYALAHDTTYHEIIY